VYLGNYGSVASRRRYIAGWLAGGMRWHAPSDVIVGPPRASD
jgi:hypothetical protein